MSEGAGAPGNPDENPMGGGAIVLGGAASAVTNGGATHPNEPLVTGGSTSG